MAQISLYIDDMLAKSLTAAANVNGCSISRYVSEIIIEKLEDTTAKEREKKEMLRHLYGCLAESEDFEEPSEIDWKLDAAREINLI